MRGLLRSFLLNLASLWIVGQLIPGVSFGEGYRGLLLAALVLGLVNLFVKPLINILLLPLNILTLGTFRWLVNVASLYLVTIFVPQFKISGFFYPGFLYQGFVIPALTIGSFWALVLTSFILSLLLAFFYWLVR